MSNEIKECFAIMEREQREEHLDHLRRNAVRECICADPENCTQAVPGYRCRAGRSCGDRTP